MYLLDTNVISELRRRDRIAPDARRWLDSIPESELFISAVTLFEIQRGALRRRRRDEAQGALFIDWISRLVIPSFSGRILVFDAEIALLCAALHVPDPRPERDAMIAATALHHGMIVITRNVRDFVPMGVPVLNPWDQPHAQ
jgi:predicted nucleic acid-binding protein